jgi:hypothetical protein
MRQLQVSVPPLSTGQTESYINLLIAQFNLSTQDFQELCQSLRECRTGDAFTPTFNAAWRGRRWASRLLKTSSVTSDGRRR